MKHLLLLVRCAFPLVVASTAHSVTMDRPSPRTVAVSRTRRAAILSVVPTILPVALRYRSLPCWANQESLSRPFVYSDDWTGTAMSVMSLEEAVHLERAPATSDASVGTSSEVVASNWPMARWPDPILRRPASPVPQRFFGSAVLTRACQLLQGTARKEKAAGLAAEQCGVDARIIYLDDQGTGRSRYGLDPLVMVNPRIVERSLEAEMKVWNERCLVLPPSFTATVLRDAWVEVEYQDPSKGAWRTIRLAGEAARAFQHEYDHDHGILITDHVSFAEMDSDLMARIEADGHTERMRQAYERDVYPRPT
jgi:peptide deformylase